MNDYERVCKEWLKGCSCATKDKPEDCEPCTKGFLDAIKSLSHKKTTTSQASDNCPCSCFPLL